MSEPTSRDIKSALTNAFHGVFMEAFDATAKKWLLEQGWQPPAAAADPGVITLNLPLETAAAVADALSYWSTSEGGNNYEMGYGGEDGAEDLRSATLARDVMETLAWECEKGGR